MTALYFVLACCAYYGLGDARGAAREKAKARDLEEKTAERWGRGS